jgi:hypothetical protein
LRRSQITRERESLVLYKSFNTLCFDDALVRSFLSEEDFLTEVSLSGSALGQIFKETRVYLYTVTCIYDDSGMISTSIVLYNEVILHPWYCTCTVDNARGILYTCKVEEF